MVSARYNISALVITLLLSGCMTNGGTKDVDNWTCDAKGIVNYRYDGSDYAYIHLSGYTKGNRYKVTKSADGNYSEGKTGDGTRFSCLYKS